MKAPGSTPASRVVAAVRCASLPAQVICLSSRGGHMATCAHDGLRPTRSAHAGVDAERPQDHAGKHVSMLTHDELTRRLVADLESDHVERKESLSGSAKERIGQAICAFANDLSGSGKSGFVIIGLSDTGESTSPSPTTSSRTWRRFAAMATSYRFRRSPWRSGRIRDCDVVVVDVRPSQDPPVRYYGQVWVHVRPRRAIASREEERVLVERRQSGDLPFDAASARLHLERPRSRLLPRCLLGGGR